MPQDVNTNMVVDSVMLTLGVYHLLVEATGEPSALLFYQKVCSCKLQSRAIFRGEGPSTDGTDDKVSEQKVSIELESVKSHKILKRTLV